MSNIETITSPKLPKTKQSVNFGDLEKVKVECYPWEFVEKFPRRIIKVSEKLQTQERWHPDDKDSFFYTLLNNIYDDSIVIFDINSGIEKAKKDGNEEDLQILTNLQSDGFEFISMDGNHRSQNMWDHKNIKMFPHKNVVLIKYKYISIAEMHNAVLRKNEQKSWTPREKRNAIISDKNNFVRDITMRFTDDITDNIGVSNDRYANNEFFTKLFFIYCNTENRIDNPQHKELKKFLEADLPTTYQKNFPIVLDVLSKIIRLYLDKTDTKKEHRMHWVTLFMFCDYLLQNKKHLLNETYFDFVAGEFIKTIREIDEDKSLSGQGEVFDQSNRSAFTNINNRVKYFIYKMSL